MTIREMERLRAGEYPYGIEDMDGWIAENIVR